MNKNDDSNIEIDFSDNLEYWYNISKLLFLENIKKGLNYFKNKTASLFFQKISK